jgi:hypothetical protein
MKNSWRWINHHTSHQHHARISARWHQPSQICTRSKQWSMSCIAGRSMTSWCYILSRVLTNQMIDHHIWMTTLVLSLLRIQTKMVITKSHVGPATKHYTLEQNGRGSMQRWWNDGGRTQWRERRRLRSSLWWMVILLHMPLQISILLRTAVVVKTWICRVANVKRS